MSEKEKGTQGESGVMSKEEMRAKIRESLAQRQALEEAGLGEETSTHEDNPAPTAQPIRGGYAPKYSGAPLDTEAYNRGGQRSNQHSPNLSTSGNRQGNNGQNRTGENAPQSRPSHTGQGNRQGYRQQSAPSHTNNKSGKGGYATRGGRNRRRGGGTSVMPKRVLIGVLIAIVVIILAAYFIGMGIYSQKFLPHTTVNSIDVSGMTREEAGQVLIENVQDMGITFVTRDGEEISFKGTSFGCTTSIADDALDEAMGESHATWFIKLFSESEYTVELEQTYSEDALESLIAAYDWGNTPPVDAKIVEDVDGTFSIQEEDNGNMVDTQILSDYALEKVRAGDMTINMAMSGCYKEADVKAADLEDTLDLYTQYATVVITYDMTNREELFDPAGEVVLDYHTFFDWVTFDSKGNLSLDREAATRWVEEKIVEPYDTFCEDGYTRSFESTMDGTVNLVLTQTSTYGWQTDVEATADAMEGYLQSGESVTVEPEWIQAGFRPVQADGTTFGEGTYIEVDICNQHLWFYVDGELFMDTDVVTGLASDPERQTHPGVFKIRDKQRNAVLGTYEVQGYEQPVSFWMPIDHTGIGLHDLSRSAYGGEIYLTNGSHGCVNLPYSAAEEIYNETVVGMPVIIVE